MKELIRWHLRKYPKAQPCDMVKLLYQGEFGGGHLLKNREYAINRLKFECENIKQTEVCLFEDVGNGMLRMDLRGMQSAGLSLETVAGLFAQTCVPMGSPEGLEDKIGVLREMAADGETPFSLAELDAYLAGYRAQSMPAVSHSETYRQAYEPAYRLVPAAAQKYLALFGRIDAMLREQQYVVVKLDGGSASGKSTLGALLQQVYEGQLFHMDDYFLPMDRKTPERLAEPGGNVDYERFGAEVDGSPLDAPVRYRPYSCQYGKLQDWVEVPTARVRIIEGAYSLHPALKKPDISVFLEIDEEKQAQRILKRNGEWMLKRFQNEWIPLEKTYFEAFKIREICDFCFEV